MVGIRKRGEDIRQFILNNVEHNPKDIVALTSRAYDISRQAVNKHIKRLVEKNALLERGATRNKRYILHPLVKWEHIYTLNGTLAEDAVWRGDISEFINDLPDNVIDIWHYGFTEILNNAIDHSSGTQVHIQITKTATTTEIVIYDDGEGIFKKIQRELELSDERHSVLELAKGKLTTDPDNHTGEGIFFSSRMFDDFAILSGSVCFSHKHDQVEDWILERQKFQSGTGVFMVLFNNTARTPKSVFDKFTSGDDYGFTKTVVPVRLTQYGHDNLVSRSQAKRLLAGVEKFETVIFDFDNVETIGQAFADEIFRVFKLQQPDMELIYLNSNEQVTQMITRALSRE
ncbi:STAS-like domain-containing protein [Candidatus Spongiihabitans sp.]|uniref:STAS-like domain-containing protein n=1 Tax=Candidatus Spongiihabitans sp. TaxID=3101308 RepID=UPI003C6FFF26